MALIMLGMASVSYSNYLEKKGQAPPEEGKALLINVNDS